MNTPIMRAKMEIDSVREMGSAEELNLKAVGKSEAYPEGGEDENNTYARYTPSATLQMHIANPALLGKFKPGQQFYVDFTPV